jgi:putative colanic acid biosynthesis UDP-glucose lipid carrier transferase
MVVLSLFLSLLYARAPISHAYVALGLLAFLLSAQILSPARFKTEAWKLTANFRLIGEWACVVASLLLLIILLRVQDEFSSKALFGWFVATPVVLAAADRVCALLLARGFAAVAGMPSHIIIGLNDIGLELAARVEQGQFFGFFDYRSAERLPDAARSQLIGHCRDVAEYVRHHSINSVYIALPISTSPRITELLEALRDTTASIYFVPNLFAFDLVQARCVDVNGMPVLAICDTPLRGMSAILKRAVDMSLAVLALAVLWPLLALVAFAVRLSSPGPILFKQKRYGLNSQEITVYKFRTMTVCENGPVVTQATKNDSRITRVGRFLRETSLDELPQILNVLEGKMSFVGPRPHAVAHNEQYRKLISGYMIRHKVRPGITGWAQVNGFRGETDTIDKMKMRVQYDLDYLRSWSLGLDIKIIFKTALSIFRDQNAY